MRHRILFIKLSSATEKQHIHLKNIHPDFVGREGYLKDLETICLKNRDQTLPVAVLWGDGGVGKSETAVAFGNLYAENFSRVHWIECDTRATYDQGYRALAKEFNIFLAEKDSLAAIREKVHGYLEKETFLAPWLIIFDNAERLLELPEKGNGAIIIISRNRGIWHPFHRINITPFDEKEALSLMEKVTKTKERKERKDLIRELDYFPLALNQAAHYIKETPKMTDQEYLRLLQHNKPFLLKLMLPDSRYPYSLAASWKISTDYLLAKFPEAFEWLQFCSYLYPDSIPKSWILQVAIYV